MASRNETNAHPHATDNVAVVHNGINREFRELRQMLEKQGAKILQRDRHRDRGSSGQFLPPQGRIARRTR